MLLLEKPPEVSPTLFNHFQVDEKMRLEMEQDRIIWPGGLRSKPTGLMIPTHLNVLTIIETPFVDGRRVERASDCNDDEIVCPVYEGKKKGIFYHELTIPMVS